MKKKSFIFILLTIFCFNCHAEENKNNKIESNKGELRANIKRIALDFSQTTVKNAKEYQDSPYTQLNANDEMMVKGVFDFALELEKPNYRWDNKIFAIYGKTTSEDNIDGTKTSSENADQILFTSDYSRKMWKIKQADIGPFVNIAYQTEFTKDTDAPRNKIIRGMLGIKLFNGKHFSDLYLANIVETDLTYSKTVNKYGLELAANATFNVREGVSFKFEGYYRDYIAYSSFNPNDLTYDLNFIIRMDVKITDILDIAPFISFRQAKSRGANKYARNTNIGISFSYSELFTI